MYSQAIVFRKDPPKLAEAYETQWRESSSWGLKQLDGLVLVDGELVRVHLLGDAGLTWALRLASQRSTWVWC